MEYKSVTTGSILTLLVALVLPHAANATSTQELQQSSVTTAASATRWLEVRRPERLKKMQVQPRPQAVLEIYHVAFSPKWEPLAVGLPIGIYVAFTNKWSPGSTTSEFRIYLSRDGQVLQKLPINLIGGLRAGRPRARSFRSRYPTNRAGTVGKSA